jgi:hypothetical protein
LDQRAAAQYGKVTAREPNDESKGRQAIVTEIRECKDKFRADLKTIFHEEAIPVFELLLAKFPKRITAELAQLKNEIDPWRAPRKYGEYSWRIEDSCGAVTGAAGIVRRYMDLPQVTEDTSVTKIVVTIIDDRMNEIEAMLDAADNKDAQAAEDAERQSMAKWLEYERDQAQKAKEAAPAPSTLTEKPDAVPDGPGRDRDPLNEFARDLVEKNLSIKEIKREVKSRVSKDLPTLSSSQGKKMVNNVMRAARAARAERREREKNAGK